MKLGLWQKELKVSRVERRISDIGHRTSSRVVSYKGSGVRCRGAEDWGMIGTIRMTWMDEGMDG